MVFFLAFVGSGETFLCLLNCLACYRAGPLHSGVQYDVTAEKEGYILTKKDGSSDFQAFKLGEVKVQVNFTDFRVEFIIFLYMRCS